MPGIAGLITEQPDGAGASVNLMLQCMMHEPFYSSGSYANNALGLWAGWVSQAGTFSDCLPIWNERKDLCLIFSGEDFADKSLIAHLKSKGHEVERADA